MAVGILRLLAAAHLCLAGFGLLAPSAAWADGITVRAGSHGDFGRIVYTLPANGHYTMARLGDLVVLTFPDGGAVPGSDSLPPNVRSISGGTNQAAIGLAPGARPHVWQVDKRVIVDVFAGNATDATPAAVAPASPRA